MIDVRNVKVSFGGGRIVAVDHISFQLNHGDRTMIIGETGSGKSALILALLGLLPESASVSGQVFFEGRDLFEMSREELDSLRGNSLAYIPQGGGASLNPLLKVGFQVGETLIEHKGYTRKQAIAASIPLMKRFRLGREEQLAESYAHIFSGGMRQRAMIAMGIANDPQWIFADEPTKGLDDRRISQVIDFFAHCEESLLCVTHDLRFARAVGRKALVMYAAQAVHELPMEELFEEPLHPYTRALIKAQPENGMICEVGFAPLHEEYAQTGCRFAPRCPDCMQQCSEQPPLYTVGKQKVRCWMYAD